MIQVKENLCKVNNFVIEPENKGYNFKIMILSNDLVDGVPRSLTSIEAIRGLAYAS